MSKERRIGLSITSVLAFLSKTLNLWIQFGILINKITSPVILAVMFFLVMTPIGLLLKIFRIDLLKFKFDPEAESYWIETTYSAVESMNHQF